MSCAELQQQPGGADLSSPGDEDPLVHPVTRSASRWLVHPRAPPVPDHHSMGLCRELETYADLARELEAEAELPAASDPRRPLRFDNAAFYYLYNRLVDFLRSREVVSGQIGAVLAACQPGEVVIRDALYRLGVAQINTEQEEAEEDGGGAGERGEGGGGGGGAEQDAAVYEVVLH